MLRLLQTHFLLFHPRRHLDRVVRSGGHYRGKSRSVLNLPSRAGRTNQQQHRDNVQAQTPSDYHKREVAIPLLDHLQSEMKTYFNPTNDAALSSLFNLLPELLAVGDRNSYIEAAQEFYENDLPSPHVVDVELLRWKRKWYSSRGCRPPVQFRYSQHAIDSSFLPSTP